MRGVCQIRFGFRQRRVKFDRDSLIELSWKKECTEKRHLDAYAQRRSLMDGSYDRDTLNLVKEADAAA